MGISPSRTVITTWWLMKIGDAGDGRPHGYYTTTEVEGDTSVITSAPWTNGDMPVVIFAGAPNIMKGKILSYTFEPAFCGESSGKTYLTVFPDAPIYDLEDKNIGYPNILKLGNGNLGGSCPVKANNGTYKLTIDYNGAKLRYYIILDL